MQALRIVSENPRPNAAEMVAKMAADLRRLNVMGSERDAIRALTSCGYRMGDVAILAEDALYAARQGAVTKTMGAT
jgi:hypothetical protein